MKVAVVISSLVVSSFLLACVDAFVPSGPEYYSRKKALTTTTTSRLLLSSDDDDCDDGKGGPGDSRRDFMAKTIATASSAALGGGVGVLVPPLPAHAVRGADKVNARLKAFGLPPIMGVPNGMVPLLEVYGKGKNRFPLLVLMNHPITWVVTLPSNDVNGEDGTIQAGEYAKGDTATLYVYSDEGHVNNIGNAEKSLFERAIIKAISQKGNNMYQNFKITKVVPQSGPEYGGKEYVICDFKYELLTGAGFEVDRRGVAAITSEGPAVEVLWCASTRERYKKTENVLRDITSSFRVYADGLNFSEELVTPDELFG